MKKSVLATMTRTLSSLFASSVPILQAMSMTEKIVENEVISRVIAKSRESLERGGSLTEPMNGHWAFPPLIPHMIPSVNKQDPWMRCWRKWRISMKKKWKPRQIG